MHKILYGYLKDAESRFIDFPLVVEYVDGNLWRVHREVGYRLRDGRCVMARKGFEFDFASVPWLLRWLAPKTGFADNPYGPAALFHDVLYRDGMVEGGAITRAYADGVFLEIMLYLGVSWWLANGMYWAVRMGSGWVWRKYRTDQANLTDREVVHGV
jgi:hypothetical protein